MLQLNLLGAQRFQHLQLPRAPIVAHVIQQSEGKYRIRHIQIGLFIDVLEKAAILGNSSDGREREREIREEGHKEGETEKRREREERSGRKKRCEKIGISEKKI